MKINQLRNHIYFFNDENFSASLFDAQFLQDNQYITGKSVGRGTTWFFEHKQKEYVLRHYYRGGLVGKVNPDNFVFYGLKNTRAFQEFLLLETMVKLDLPVPMPYAGRIIKNGLFYRADLIIELIEGAQDLVAILTKQKITPLLWKKIGQTIRLFHDNNIYHSDMNSHNIMLDELGKAWLIDFDKCAQRKDGDWKQQTLQRLLRSFRKEKNKNSGLNWQEKDWLILMQGYQTES